MNNKSLEQENYFLKEMIRTYYQPEIERLNNNIEEAREYIETQQKIFKDYDIAMENQLKNVLEILDKAGSDK